MPVKIRVAVALRRLAGASYIDVAVLFGIAKETVFHVLWQVVDVINSTPKILATDSGQPRLIHSKTWPCGSA